MDGLGPFEPQPFLAVAVSGGADSLALALLTNRWVRDRSGSLLAMVVDHGLRPASAAEAAMTMHRLASRGIAAQLLQLRDLSGGPGLAARARTARYGALLAACASAGCLHLLLGHHRADQAETVMIRALSGSRSAGLAAMPALSEVGSVRLLRPLLAVPPVALKAFLRAEAMCWVEDPSNRDPHALRARLRGSGASGEADLAAAAATAGRARAAMEHAEATVLAERVGLRPEGFALMTPGRILPTALSALLQTIAGTAFAPASAAVEALAAAPAPATLGGVRIMPAGRMGPGWLLVRESASMQPPVPAADGALWDGRFRLEGDPPAGATLGALGADAARFRSRSGLPTAVLRTLGSVRSGKMLVAVPHLGYADRSLSARLRLCFLPPRPLAGAPFCPPEMG